MPARALVGKACTHAPRACSLASAYMKWDGNAEGRRQKKKSEGNEEAGERKRQKVEENFDVRSYAIARGEGAPGPSFPCAPKGPHCLLLRDSIAQCTASSYVRRSSFLLYLLFFLSARSLRADRRNSRAFAAGKYFLHAVPSSAPRIFTNPRYGKISNNQVPTEGLILL